MKKIMWLIFLFLLVNPIIMVHAEDSYVGTVRYSDVVTYINNFSIPSYNMNGYTFVKVEDLGNYGFDVLWNEFNKTLRISRGETNDVNELITFRAKPKNVGKKDFDMHKTEVRTFIGNYAYEIECLAGIPGYTFINVDNLNVFGSVAWDEENQNVMIWIEDGLEMASYKHYVAYEPYDVRVSTYSCNRLNTYFCNGVGTQEDYYVFFGIGDVVNEEITEVSKCFGKLYVKIFDSEGAVIFDGSQYFNTASYSMLPYCFGYIETPLSIMYQIPADQIKPTAYNNGIGLVKVYYWCDCHQYGLEYEYRTDALPVQNNPNSQYKVL